MPGTLRLTNLTILHAHKRYRLLNTFSSSSATVTSAAGHSRPISRLKYFSVWCRTNPCAPAAAQIRIIAQSLRSRDCQNFYFCTSCSENKAQDGTHNRKKNNSLGTQMGAADNGKVENQHYASDVSLQRNCREKFPAQRPKLLTLPMMLTIGRVAAVPLLISTFYVESWWGPTTTTGIFIVASITDWLDGYLARKMKLGSPFGAFLDPVADKLIVAATLILLCTRPLEAGMLGKAPWLLTVPAIAIIGREITMSAVREWAASQDRKLLEAVAVNNLGKWKTVTQMSALTFLLASRDTSIVGPETLVSSGVVLLYISASLAVWSLVVYMKKIWKVLLTK